MSQLSPHKMKSREGQLFSEWLVKQKALMAQIPGVLHFILRGFLPPSRGPVTPHSRAAEGPGTHGTLF
jgi:hypothetical protein